MDHRVVEKNRENRRSNVLAFIDNVPRPTVRQMLDDCSDFS